MICGIDPGTTHSGVVLYDENLGKVVQATKDMENDGIAHVLKCLLHFDDIVVCEWIESYGMPVGKETFQTIRWIGRFEQICLDRRIEFVDVTRRSVKLFLCNNMRAKDSNVRQAIIDRYGGKREAIGLKKTPGPLYGVSSHAWNALAVIVTHMEGAA